eukprot:Hpha_TRINITY_DN15426_c3_g5::TRINITY_DN15426_c3_g5_i1::g.176593::m.176593
MPARGAEVIAEAIWRKPDDGDVPIPQPDPSVGPIGSVKQPPEKMPLGELRQTLQSRGLSAEGNRARLLKRFYESTQMVGGATAKAGNTCAVPCRKDGTPKWWAKEWYNSQHEKRRRVQEETERKEDEAAEAAASKMLREAAQRAECMLRRTEWKKNRTLRAASLALPPDCPTPTRVLHLGCGDGSRTAALRAALEERFPEGGEVVGVDLDATRVKMAEAGAGGGNVERVWQARFVCADVATLDARSLNGSQPAKRGGFDAIIVSDLLQALPSLPCSILAALLRPGGRVGVVAWGSHAFDAVLGAIREVVLSRGLNPDMAREHVRVSPEELRKASEEAGLRVEECEVGEDPVEIPPPSAPWLVSVARPYIAAFESDFDWMQEFSLDLKSAVADRGLFQKKPSKIWRLDMHTLTATLRPPKYGDLTCTLLRPRSALQNMAT